MGLFSRNLVDIEIAEWQFEYFAWLIENYSSGPGLPDSDLWLPIASHFSPDNAAEEFLEGTELAQHLFTRVGEQCGFGTDHPIQLLEKEDPKTGFLDGGAILNMEGGGSCGLYVVEQADQGFDESIYYDLSMTNDPNALIATFAHEYSHALHNRSKTELDIEPELYELFTDLTAIFLGYGVFLGNTRFDFQMDDRGWSARGAGYLPPTDMMFATAIFMRVKNIPIDLAIDYLKPNLVGMLKKAFKQLDKYETEIDELRRLAPSSK